MIKLLGLLVLVGSVGFLNMNSGSLERDVKSGELGLYCLIDGVRKKIDPELIEYEQDGYWKFSNGGASNCRVK